MNKHNSCIYLFCRFPFFNPEKIPLFESFDAENSAFLYSSLLLNHKEILENLSPIINYYYCFNEMDKGFTPPDINPDHIIWIDNRGIRSSSVNEKYFSACNNNMLVMADSIGLAPNDFKKVINLLSIEDDVIVIGKTYNNKAGLIGFNILSDSFFDEFDWSNLAYEYVLNIVCKQNSHLHIVDKFILAENISDFKALYTELSKKESLSYCSHEMHEKFTHLFIEYKELLK